MSEQDSYPLTRGPQQLVRVHLLQHLWHATNGYLVHPVVDRPANRHLRIADVATASGLWLCEVARLASKNDKFELHGFDISDASFITSDQLPQNVKLHVSDARTAPPERFIGQFDIVHVRLLQAVIIDNDPKWVIKYCMELLRPGGYLQWEEFDPNAVTVQSQTSGGDALESLLQQLHTRVPSEWVESLPKHMTEVDLEVVTTERRHESDYNHPIITYLHCLVFEEYAYHIQGDAGKRLLDVVQAAYRETQQGAYVKYLFQTVLARKRQD